MTLSPHFITKQFAHHSTYSGYDRLLDFIPHKNRPFFPAHWFYSDKYKATQIDNCLARWDHYGTREVNAELDIMWYPSLFKKRIFHYLYGENTFCSSADRNRNNKIFIGTYHQPESWFKSFWKERYDYFISKIALLDGVIAVSKNQADFFKQFNDNVFCVHHGIDVDFFAPAVKEERDPNLCLFVGNWLRDFETLKKCSIIMKAIAPEIRIQAITPPKNHAALDGAEVELICGIDDVELRQRYRTASVALLPLLDCTANNSALEAMACGLPIVVTDVGGIHDYVSEDCAIFCKPGDAEEMVNAVITLMRDKEKSTKMGAVARQRAEYLFAWPKVAGEMIDVYRHFL